MTQSSIANGMTSAFDKSGLFNKEDDNRVSCTRLRIAGSTLMARLEDVDLDKFATEVMKNRPSTTRKHYVARYSYQAAVEMTLRLGKEFNMPVPKKKK